MFTIEQRFPMQSRAVTHINSQWLVEDAQDLCNLRTDNIPAQSGKQSTKFNPYIRSYWKVAAVEKESVFFKVVALKDQAPVDINVPKSSQTPQIGLDRIFKTLKDIKEYVLGVKGICSYGRGGKWRI